MRWSKSVRALMLATLVLMFVIGSSSTALAKKGGGGGDAGVGWHDAQGYEGPGAPWSEAHP